MMLKNLRTVNQWYKMPTITSDTVDTLEKVFQNVTGEGSPISYFFQDIYVPILDRDSTTHAPSDPPTFTYKNVGMTTTQLTDTYWTLYGYNMLSVPLIPSNVDPLKYSQSVAELSTKMKSIFALNKYKYLKWIDTMGYAYNPLWNVDGSESFQYIDTHGKVTKQNAPILNTSNKVKTNSYDGELKDTNETILNYNNTDTETTGVSGLRSVDTEDHNDITGGAPISGPVTAITGGDYSHIEKRIRQGNIGVTQTSELLQNERDLVRFNLIQEFFNDINKQLLVGIFPGF